MRKISIVIPVYNSEDCLKELYQQISEYVSADHEVIFVNDQSPDKSWDIISSLAKTHNNIIGINLRKNMGQDNALMAGLSKVRGEYVVIMDDDLQHSPKDIDAMLNACEEGYDVCYATYAKKKQALWKNIGSWLNGKVAEWMLNKPKNLYLSPFKIFKKEVACAMCQYAGPYPYIDGLILAITNNIKEIEVEHQKRFAGKSNFSLLKSFGVSANHITGFSVFPLRLAAISGALIAFAGFLLGLYYIYVFLTTHNRVEGWTTLVVLNLFVGGVILTSLGIIGEYVGRSYLLLNNKSQYNIKEVVGYE